MNTLTHIIGIIGTSINRVYELCTGQHAQERIRVANSHGKKTVQKRHTGIVPDLSYFSMRHEAAILRILSKLQVSESAPFTVRTPKISEHTYTLRACTLSTEFIPGASIESERSETVIQSIISVIGWLKHIPTAHTPLSNLPKRGAWYFVCMTPLLCIRAILRDPKYIKMYMRMCRTFYTHFNYLRLISEEYLLTHRDLFASNILLDRKRKTLHVLDWESAILSDPLYDIALIPWQYARELTAQQLLETTHAFIPLTKEKHHAAALTLFAAIQSRAIESKSSHMYQDALTAAEWVFSTALLAIPKEHFTVFEKINSITLYAISALYSMFPFLPTKPAKGLVLCYHSVSDSGWRFSTPVGMFAEQIQWLRDTYSIQTLSQVSEPSTESTVAVSFDDGYQDVYTNAYPILHSFGITATVFILGKGPVDRKALDNELRLLSTSQIHALHTSGWEIGFHTTHHHDMGTLTDSQLRSEIVTGKQDRENELGYNLTSFAYPKGVYSTRIISCVKEAGFKTAWSVDGGYCDRYNTPYLRDRVAIDGRWSMIEFTSSLTPIGLSVGYIYWKILVMKDRVSKKIRIFAS